MVLGNSRPLVFHFESELLKLATKDFKLESNIAEFIKSQFPIWLCPQPAIALTEST